jgi:hypothetical protein
MGESVVDLARRYPGARLILAHAGISDLSWIAAEAAVLPNLFFDTAWWLVSDHLHLYSSVPPARILYASDMPYGPAVATAFIFQRVGRAVGLDHDALLTIAGAQLERVMAGEDPVDLGPAPGPRAVGERVIEAERVVSYAAAAMQIAFRGLDPTEPLALARLACNTGRDDEVGALLRYVDRVLAIAEERRYPLVSSHTGTGGTWHESELRRLFAVGGFASATLDAAGRLPEKVLAFRQLGATTVGLSTDTGGFAALPAPAPDAPLAYPFRSWDGRVSFAKQKTGERSFDLNTDGMAHYGLLPDLLALMRTQPRGAEALTALFGSAEAYLRMWQRARPLTRRRR